MIRGSLRRRLLGAAALSISIALALACFGLILLFERHVTRRLDAELDTYLRQLVASVEVTAEGAVRQAQTFAEPRFQQPYSGLYWQIIDDTNGNRLSSRSLWDAVIPLPQDELADAVAHRHEVSGPAGAQLIAHERRVTIKTKTGQYSLLLAVAVDSKEIDSARSDFLSDILPSLGLLALALFGATWVQVGVGLQPLEAVRRGLHTIREGAANRLHDGHPDEVMPLVTEVNKLLDAQEQAIERARTQAADLAHGLKTPLTLLAADTRQLRELGEATIADDIDAVAETMRRHIERELARARTRGAVHGAWAKIMVAPVVLQLVNALGRTPRGEHLSWTIDVPETLAMPMDRDDLAEVLGNLLDNAIKWAGSAIHVTGALSKHGSPYLQIEDDGPGIAEDDIPTVLARGGRLSDEVSGTGLGLAIVQDVMAAYGSQVTLDRSRKLGGLSVTIALAPKRPDADVVTTEVDNQRAAQPILGS